MAGGVKLAGVHGSGATVHGWRNRTHRKRGREQGITLRSRRRPEGKAEAASAMAGGRKLVDAHKTRSTAYETGNKLHGEREGITVKLTKGEMETGAARGRLLARRFRARRWWIPATFACGGCGLPRCLASAKTRAGNSNRGCGDGLGFLL